MGLQVFRQLLREKSPYLVAKGDILGLHGEIHPVSPACCYAAQPPLWGREYGLGPVSSQTICQPALHMNEQRNSSFGLALSRQRAGAAIKGSAALCPVAASRPIPTSKSARPNILKKGIAKRASAKRKPSAAPGRPSTRMKAAARNQVPAAGQRTAWPLREKAGARAARLRQTAPLQPVQLPRKRPQRRARRRRRTDRS